MEHTYVDTGTHVAPGLPDAEPKSDIDIIRFFNSPIDNEDYIEITKVGDTTYQFIEYATDFYKGKYPEQWNAYEVGLSSVAQGETLLSNVPWIPDIVRRRLEAANIFSLERLITLPESTAGQMGPGTPRLQEKAKAFIHEKNKMAGIAEENEALKDQVAELRDMVMAMRAETQAPKPAPTPAPKVQPKGN